MTALAHRGGRHRPPSQPGPPRGARAQAVVRAAHVARAHDAPAPKPRTTPLDLAAIALAATHAAGPAGAHTPRDGLRPAADLVGGTNTAPRTAPLPLLVRPSWAGLVSRAALLGLVVGVLLVLVLQVGIGAAW